MELMVDPGYCRMEPSSAQHRFDTMAIQGSEAILAEQHVGRHKHYYLAL